MTFYVSTGTLNLNSVNRVDQCDDR